MIEIRKEDATAEEWQKALYEIEIGDEYLLGPRQWYTWTNHRFDMNNRFDGIITAIRRDPQSEKQTNAKNEATIGIQLSAQEISELIDEVDNIQNPSHYTHGGIETIDFIKAKLSNEEYIGFLKGNCIKYLSRAGKKDSELDDYKKAQWYLGKLIEEKTIEG